jgi:hypothetical protein
MEVAMDTERTREPGPDEWDDSDFARGQDHIPAGADEEDEEGSDFARGQRDFEEAPEEREGPDFARGQRTYEDEDEEGPDFARGQE